jgi:hypothetical protein
MDQFLPDDRLLLVSLPYRVGLFVSESDRSGGDESDAREMQALTNIIVAYSQEVFGAETAQYIISETVSRRQEWQEWSNDLDMIESECHRAVDVLSEFVDVKEVNGFKRCLMEIGEAVALAFREYDESVSIVEKTKIYIAYMQSRMQATKLGIVAKEWDQFINISMEERSALQGVAAALDTKYV